MTQATQSRPGSSATPTSNKKVGPCVRHLSNKKPPPFLDSSHSLLTPLLPVWPVGVSSARAVQLQRVRDADMSRRTHPALQPARSSRSEPVTHCSRQLAKPFLGGSQDLGHCDGELQGTQHHLNKHKGLQSGVFSSLAFWL